MYALWVHTYSYLLNMIEVSVVRVQGQRTAEIIRCESVCISKCILRLNISASP